MITHTLTWLLAIPLLGSLVVLAIPSSREGVIKRFSIGVMLVEFLLSLRLYWVDYSTPGYRLVEQVAWVESLGISYKVGVDGLSLWLVLLTTALTPIALYASWGSIATKIKEYAFSFLLLELGMLGAFVALDLFLFYVFWELMLVPMYLIIGVWGGKDRVYAAVKFFLYTFFGSLLMLVAILYIVAAYKELTGQYTFDLEKLTTLMLPAVPQYLLFSAFAVAFAIKVPMFPFHTWLPDAHVQAPTGGSVILAAVLLKLGIYGFIRFAMPLFPVASQVIGPTLAGLGVFGIIYGAYAAWVQRDLKKLVAYSSVSHMGFILLGLFAMNRQGVSGAILQMINHGVSTGALFLLVGVIYDRRHSRMLDDFGGLAKVMPWYATAFVIITMSSIGLPGTNGFVGEFMILGGAFFSRGAVGLGTHWFAMTLLAATGVIFAAVYMLHAVLRMFWGKVTHEENESLPDLNRREAWALIPLVVLVFWIGLYPKFFLDKMTPSVDAFISDFSIRYRQSRGISKPQLADLKAIDPEETGSYVLAHHVEEGR
ncbi:MAG: NADH-quinone oxidoreductase subunit M [Myxococcales bacterium]|nr:NADH-quinone oxidoreductase subunit M [Myxococcales bacterium]MDH3484663.1 NADH-quinone oxidoreductase subunit M [Myxococcales bacterium]